MNSSFITALLPSFGSLGRLHRPYVSGTPIETCARRPRNSPVSSGRGIIVASGMEIFDMLLSRHHRNNDAEGSKHG